MVITAFVFSCLFICTLSFYSAEKEVVQQPEAIKQETTIAEQYLKTPEDKEEFLENLKEYPEWDHTDSMNFSSRETVDKLREVYGELKGEGGYSHLSDHVFDYYGEKYMKLLNHEAKFYNPSSGNYYDIDVWGLDINDSIESFDGGGVMIDIDDDKKPELYIRDVRSTYIFKYLPDQDQYLLWWRTPGGNANLHGRKEIWNFILKTNTDYLLRLNENGKEVYRVDFDHPIHEAYTVILPIYYASERYSGATIKDEDVIEMMKNDGYLDRYGYSIGYEIVYFRVTEEEFNELREIPLNEYYTQDPKAYRILVPTL